MGLNKNKDLCAAWKLLAEIFIFLLQAEMLAGLRWEEEVKAVMREVRVDKMSLVL